MSDKKLTQAQIDAMLEEAKSTKSVNDTTTPELSDTDLECINTFIEKSIVASKDVLQIALSKDTQLVSSSGAKISTSTDILSLVQQSYIGIKIDYSGEVEGFDLLLIKKDNIFDLARLQLSAMGLAVDEDSLNEIGYSATCELMNQMMAKYVGTLSTEYNLNVDISVPKIKEINNYEDSVELLDAGNETYIFTSYTLKILDSGVSVDILKILDLNFARNLNSLLNDKKSDKIDTSIISKMEDESDNSSFDSFEDELSFESLNHSEDNLNINYSLSQENDKKLFGGEHRVENSNTTKVFPYHLNPTEQSPPPQTFNLSINKLNDVPIELSVELGRTTKSIKDVLNIGKGSIIELNKLSGEPVELYANGTLICTGEVVIVKDYFAVKVLNIVDKKEG